MKTREEMIEHLYNEYKLKFPLRALYKRNKNRIYFSTDFQDNEEVKFWWNCDKPSVCAMGNAFYKGKDGNTKLVNIKELENLD